uniref:Uncharacterized protein n=1 Tax=Anopheles maculatus TaxID=74869 RepID=A0A182SRL9_9DIPT
HATKQQYTNEVREKSFRTFSTSSGSSKSSQIQRWSDHSDRPKPKPTLAHPPLPKTGEQSSKSIPKFDTPSPSSAGSSSRQGSNSKSSTPQDTYFVQQDRPPLPYVSKKSSPQSKPMVPPPFAMQRSQTAMALKLSKQQQSRIAESKLKGKSLSSSNLLLLDDSPLSYAHASSGMAALGPGTRSRQIVNPREKAAKYWQANSLSMDQLNAANGMTNRGGPSSMGLPHYTEYGETALANSRTSVLPPSHYHHHLQDSPHQTSAAQQQHIVIDVVPKPPMNGSFPGGPLSSYAAQSLSGGVLMPGSSPNILDQTIGIPLVQDEPDYIRRPAGGGTRKPPPPPQSAWYSSAVGAPTSSANSNNGPRTIIHQYPLISGNIPSKFQLQQQQHQPPFELQMATAAGTGKYGTRKKLDAPTASILSNGGSNHSNATGQSQHSATNGSASNGGPNATGLHLAAGSSIGGSSGASTSSSAATKRDGAEKNKVKFSDTVTVAVVPEIPRKEKLLVEKLRKQPMQPGPVGYGPFSIADPKRELAESLPLCHPNEDYLKDFTPMQDLISSSNGGEMEKKEEEKKIPNIKVVHFGVV